jgi:hypothetical protein
MLDMAKPHISKILTEGGSLATKIDPASEERLKGLIEKTRKDQEEVLKQKAVDPELLEKVVRL